MSEKERKQMAYIAEMLWKIGAGLYLDGNELQSLDDIVSDLGFQFLSENEFM